MTNESHNGYIEVYLNLGWLGLGLIALILGQGYRRTVSAFRRDSALALCWWLMLSRRWLSTSARLALECLAWNGFSCFCRLWPRAASSGVAKRPSRQSPRNSLSQASWPKRIGILF